MKLETKVRKQVTELKFIPFKMTEHPTMIGFIQYTDSGYRIKGIGLHTNGKGYWAQWPWWKTERTGEIHFYNKPESEEHELVLVTLFVEAMKNVVDATKKGVPASSNVMVYDKVETKPKGQKPVVGDGVVFVPSHTRKWPNN